MRPSGTLQAPTTGSLEAMLRESDREDQIAAARRIPKQVNILLPDTPATYEPAKTDSTQQATVAANKTDAANLAPAANATLNTAPDPAQAVTNQAAAPTRTDVALQTDGLPQPKPAALTATQSPSAQQKTDVATALQSLVSSPTDVSKTSLNARPEVAAAKAPPVLKPDTSVPDTSVPGPKAIEPTPSLIELSLSADQSELQVGAKRQLALQVKSDAPLGLAVITLRFDPSVLKISGVSAGSLFANAKNHPTVTQSVDEHGMILLSIIPASGSPITADGVLLNLEVQGVSAGDSALSCDLSNVHLVAGDGRTLTVQIEPIKLMVK
jgi:hypothetical protein